MKFTTRQIVGVILWWTEGTKSRLDKRWKNSWSHNVEVTNTNPEMIKVFLDFLRKDIGIEENNLKLQLQIHENDDQKELERYWSNITKIPISRFNKTIIRPEGKKVGKSKGTCKIRYTNKKTFHQINDLLQKILNKI